MRSATRARNASCCSRISACKLCPRSTGAFASDVLPHEKFRRLKQECASLSLFAVQFSNSRTTHRPSAGRCSRCACRCDAVSLPRIDLAARTA